MPLRGRSPCEHRRSSSKYLPNCIMDFLVIACQVIVALGLINVWLLRRGKSTPYRGGNADNMEQEFATYGLPTRFMWLICILKLSAAAALLLGMLLPPLVVPASTLL